MYWPYPETRSDACPEFNFNISGSGTFDTVIMHDPAKIFDQHKWVVKGDMLAEAYGPVRRKLDLWRNMLHDTPRAYNQVDIAMDQYLSALSPLEAQGHIRSRGAWGGIIHPLSNTPAVALNSCSLRVPGQLTFTPEQYNVAVGFAVDKGLNALVSLVCGPRLLGQPAPAAVHAKALVSKDPAALYRAYDTVLILAAAFATT